MGAHPRRGPTAGEDGWGHPCDPPQGGLRRGVGAHPRRKPTAGDEWWRPTHGEDPHTKWSSAFDMALRHRANRSRNGPSRFQCSSVPTMVSFIRMRKKFCQKTCTKPTENTARRPQRGVLGCTSSSTVGGEHRFPRCGSAVKEKPTGCYQQAGTKTVTCWSSRCGGQQQAVLRMTKGTSPLLTSVCMAEATLTHKPMFYCLSALLLILLVQVFLHCRLQLWEAVWILL